jgi:hypothetical protein
LRGPRSYARQEPEMGANEAERGGSQSARPSKAGKGSRPKDRKVSSKAGASSTEAIQVGKASGPKDEIPASNDVASREAAAKSPRTIESHVPNAETAKVLREAREGKNLLRYESLDEMFKDLGI